MGASLHRGVLGTSNQQVTPGQTQKSLEGLYGPSILGTECQLLEGNGWMDQFGLI